MPDPRSAPSRGERAPARALHGREPVGAGAPHERGLDVGLARDERQACVRAQDEQRRRQGIRTRAGGGDHRDRDQVMGGVGARARVDDMVHPAPAGLAEAAVVARRRQGRVLERQRSQQVGAEGGALARSLDADLPGRPAGLAAPGPHLAADLHQPAARAEAVQHGAHAVHPVALGDARQVQLHQRIGLDQPRALDAHEPVADVQAGRLAARRRRGAIPDPRRRSRTAAPGAARSGRRRRSSRPPTPGPARPVAPAPARPRRARTRRGG